MSTVIDAIRCGAGGLFACRCGHDRTFEVSQQEWDRLQAQERRLKKIVEAVLEAERPQAQPLRAVS